MWKYRLVHIVNLQSLVLDVNINRTIYFHNIHAHVTYYLEVFLKHYFV